MVVLESIPHGTFHGLNTTSSTGFYVGFLARDICDAPHLCIIAPSVLPDRSCRPMQFPKHCQWLPETATSHRLSPPPAGIIGRTPVQAPSRPHTHSPASCSGKVLSRDTWMISFGRRSRPSVTRSFVFTPSSSLYRLQPQCFRSISTSSPDTLRVGDISIASTFHLLVFPPSSTRFRWITSQCPA